MSTEAKKPIWDTEPCTRCGGTGNYSFNLINGTRCFKCGGGKIQHTKTGKAASLRFKESISVETGKVQDGWMVCLKDVSPGKKVVWIQMTTVETDAQGWTNFMSVGGNKYRCPANKIIRAVPSMAARDTARQAALDWQTASLERQKALKEKKEGKKASAAA